MLTGAATAATVIARSDTAAMTTLLGFDYGTRRIGVAVGQRVTGTARALTCLSTVQDKPDWPAIGRLIDEWRPAALIVGTPQYPDGQVHPVAAAAQRFARQLEGRYRLPVHLIDESLSSIEAAALQSPRERRQQAPVDALAAQVILQTWLDCHPCRETDDE